MTAEKERRDVYNHKQEKQDIAGEVGYMERENGRENDDRRGPEEHHNGRDDKERRSEDVTTEKITSQVPLATS